MSLKNFTEKWAMIQYDDTTKKFITNLKKKTESGNLILNGGTF
ncbi:MAG: hypothetical protein CM15mV18_1430 [uncultured marine virus]|nr:MAG: hypothetical protein CM15mV18_1430 [uncultured marine virus]